MSVSVMTSTKTAAYTQLRDKRQAARVTDTMKDFADSIKWTGMRWYIDRPATRIVLPRFQDMQRGIMAGEIKRVMFQSLDQLADCIRSGVLDSGLWLDKEIEVAFAEDKIGYQTGGRILGKLVLRSIAAARNSYHNAAGERAAQRLKGRAGSAKDKQKRVKAMIRDGATHAEAGKAIGVNEKTATAMARAPYGRAWWGGHAGRVGKRKGDTRRAYKLWERGLSNHEIAGIMGLTPPTIKSYVEEELAKKVSPGETST